MQGYRPPVRINASHTFRVRPILVAHIILVHVKRFTNDIGTFLVACLPSFSVAPGLVTHIILIDVKRFTNDLRAVLVTRLGGVRAIVLLSLIAM